MGGVLTSIDYVAACLIVTGMCCHLLHRSLPAGLGTSIFVGATTLGVGISVGHHTWQFPTNEYLVLRVASVLCMVWAFFGWLASRGDESGDRVAPSATFLAWAMVTGVVAVVQAIYILVFRSWGRIVDPETLGYGLTWSYGLVDLLAILGAIAFWRLAHRRPSQPVMILCMGALATWWTSLMIPIPAGVFAGASAEGGSLRPGWWDWTFHLQIGLALLLLAATVVQDVRYRRRRHAAWPDRLDDLLAPYSRWPAYVQVESILAGVILILGVYQLVRSVTPTVWLGFASTSACLVAGTTCLFMAYRRWSGNTSGLGMALLTLAMVDLCCTLALLFLPAQDEADYGARMPVFFNAALFGLAIMIALWSWLGRFWVQQLHDGVGWTTTGRMIPYARMTAFFLGALAVLLAFQMALWPNSTPVGGDDNTGGRMIAGLLAIAMLTLINGRRARYEDRASIAGLTVAFLLAGILFVFVRAPASSLRGWIMQHDEVVLSCMALPVLVIAETLPSSKWKSFSWPLWTLSLLILPAWALVELKRPGQPAEWIQPMTLALLGALYGFAGSREHRRAFLGLAAVLLLASVTSLFRAYG
ncbi:MAG: hypothetical protein HZA51_05555 [Planctomycetes bacterium]|nr:hypothetical protein [Planctomycetota bacterium]